MPKAYISTLKMLTSSFEAENLGLKPVAGAARKHDVHQRLALVSIQHCFMYTWHLSLLTMLPEVEDLDATFAIFLVQYPSVSLNFPPKAYVYAKT